MIDEKLKELSIQLPTPPNPAGSYIPVVITGNLAFVSGQIPMKDGKVIFEGKVPEKQSLDSARDAAKICILNGLAQLKLNLGSLDKITKFVRISGFVNSNPDFIEQKKYVFIDSKKQILLNLASSIKIMDNNLMACSQHLKQVLDIFPKTYLDQKSYS